MLKFSGWSYPFEIEFWLLLLFNGIPKKNEGKKRKRKERRKKNNKKIKKIKTL